MPLDPAFPADRITFIASDASLRLLITSRAFASVAGDCCPLLMIDETQKLLEAEAAERPHFSQTADALCYIIYTSGTTGRPKGVAVNHSSICRFIADCTPIYGVQASDRVYQGMTLAFDFSIEEIWPTFAVGATLVAGPNDHSRFGVGLNDFLINQSVTVLCSVPTLLATLERDVPSLRLLLVGGEACPLDLVNRWSRFGRRMLNTYGPTEATVTATWGELRPDKPVTIGRPMPAATIHILDEVLNHVARGEEGEICIGGACVAVGYVNRPELTAERFVPDTFSNAPGAKLYRTGDLGRINESGEIEYLGRIDAQIKIRGYRIELDEIEAVLREDAGVAHAAVALVQNEGNVAELAGYVVARRPLTPTSGGPACLLGYVIAYLPIWCRPSSSSSTQYRCWPAKKRIEPGCRARFGPGYRPVMLKMSRLRRQSNGRSWLRGRACSAMKSVRSARTSFSSSGAILSLPLWRYRTFASRRNSAIWPSAIFTPIPLCWR